MLSFSKSHSRRRAVSLYRVALLLGFAGFAAFACGRSNLTAARDGDPVNAGGSGAEAGSAGSDGGSAGSNAGVGGIAGNPEGGSGGSAGDAGSGGDAGTGGRSQVDQLDLLLVIDNSLGMADKHALLAESLGDLGIGLEALAELRTEPLSVHIGVISSSLGGHGGNVCGPVETSQVPAKNDRAHLIPTLRPDVPGQNAYGFVEVELEPGGNLQRPLAGVLAALNAVGDSGCGYEAPLEAMYRFLADPDPPLEIVLENGMAVPSGLDKELLEQRQRFLRPNSAVAILLLSDENDCSVRDEGQAYLSATTEINGSRFFMPHGTSACEADPNALCCFSCAAASPSPDCPAPQQDAACIASSSDTSYDSVNLRCFQQKRRFGIDWLYPVGRYRAALSEDTVVNHAGNRVPNPLLVYESSGGRFARDPSLVTFGAIVGVPWQDLALSPDEEPLEFMSTEQLTALERWPVILGDSAKNIAPSDPFMIESTDQRQGKNPITGAPLVGADSLEQHANPINGHELVSEADELQYACTYPLKKRLQCDRVDGYCECTEASLPRRRPVCEHDTRDGSLRTVQTDGKALPGLRFLELTAQLGAKASVGSICAKETTNVSSASYGYKPAIRLFMQRLVEKLL